MSRQPDLDELRRGLLEGKGSARQALADLPPRRRHQLLLEVLTEPHGLPPPAEARRGAYHARCLLEHGTAKLARAALARVEDELRGSDQGHHILCVLAEMAARGAALPPLPFVRLAESSEDLYWKLPALRVLTQLGDEELLHLVLEAAAGDLVDAFDAKDLGEVLSQARPGADDFLRMQLTDSRPLVRLAGAYALLARPGAGGEDAAVTEIRTLADVLSFDPDPVVRVHALEIHDALIAEEVGEDPYEIVVRILQDPSLHAFMESWHWGYAADGLSAPRLSRALWALEASRDAGATEIAEVLAESPHPLAPSLIRSRLFTASPEDRPVYLQALEAAGGELDAEVLALFDLADAPPSVLVRRAREGEAAALERVLEEIESGHLDASELDPRQDRLLLDALVPAALQRITAASPAGRAALLRVFRPVLPPGRLPAPDPALLAHGDPEVVREAALDLLLRGQARDRGRVIEFLRDGPREVTLALLDHLLDHDRPVEPRLLAALLEDRDATLRAQVLRILERVPSLQEILPPLRAALEDPDGLVRAEALQVCRRRGFDLARAHVRSMLLDASDDVRGAAARYLAESEGPGALPALRALFEAEDVEWLQALLEEQIARLEEAADHHVLH